MLTYIQTYKYPNKTFYSRKFSKNITNEDTLP